MDPGGFSWTNPDAPAVEVPSSGASRHRFGRPLVAVLLIAAAVLAYTALAGNGGGGSLNPVAQAAEKTARYPGGRMTMNGSITASQQPTPLQMSSNVVFNGDTGQARATFTASGPPPFGSVSATTVIAEDSLYVRSSELPASIGAAWIKLPADSHEANQQDFTLMNPAKQLAALESVSDGITVLGREPIRGRATTRYAANLSFDKEADLMTAFGDTKSADLLGKIADRSVSDSIPINVWVDSRGLVRRLAFTISTNADSGGTVSFNMSMDFFDFGGSPHIAIPPADQVYEAGAAGDLDSLSQ
jgi:hypothetical protein